MIDIDGINYWAVVVAGLVNIVLGAFWYSPTGFGKLWTKLTGIDIMKMPQDAANKAVGVVALGAIVQAAALGLVVNSLGAETLKDGLLAGFVLWSGFVAVTTIGDTMYARRGWKFWWLNSSYFLIVILFNASLLALWR
jgi:hypothetical protein